MNPIRVEEVCVVFPETKPEFRGCTEAEVQTALNDPAAQNAVALEVGRLVAAYSHELRQRTGMPSRLPEPPQARCPIETVALHLATRLAGLPVVKGESSG